MTAMIRQVVALSKPRVISLLVLTAVAGAWKAAAGLPDISTLAVVVVAGTLAAAGSNAINQGLDADIDAVMRRTRTRPVPARQMQAPIAVALGVLLVALAVGVMGLGANLVAGALTFAASLVYVFLYTVLLKRRSWNNIVIGGAAGAFPPLIGAAAVSGGIDVVGLYMFVFVFFWTPPHFWTLSILLREDYSAANVPMLAVVASHRDTVMQILLYIVLLMALAWLPVAAGYGGFTFAIVATALGVNWLRIAWPMLGETNAGHTLAAYKYSLLYLAVAFVALAVEPMLPWYRYG